MRLMHALRKTYYRTLTRGVPAIDWSEEELRQAGYVSQYGQDRYVVERLGSLQGGVFIDVGAFDGVTLSNTWYLEKQLGWSGVCVEPSHAAFAQLQTQRKCRCVQACVGAETGRTRFLEIEGAAAMLSGRIANYHPRHLARIDREMAEAGGQRREFDLPCVTIEQLAREQGFDRIDYLSIDTEGGELAILQSIDFARLPVRLVTVENNYAETAFRQHMARQGMELVAKIACDEVYENRRMR